jgi:hypothetical protein
MFLVKIFYPTVSIITILGEFHVKSECRNAPSRFAINTLVYKFDITWSTITVRRKVSVRSLRHNQFTVCLYTVC